MMAVEARGLTKQYKTSLAVDAIDLHVPAGCCCGFLGKNGAGKTTTIKMLVGLKRPTSGSISIMGKPQDFNRRGELSVGYLPDVPNYYGYMTGAEFLDFCGKLCGIPTKERQTQALLKQVGLSKTRTRIAGYSRGMKQRLGIAQALINNPAVIFMDEPISALDPIGRRDVIDIIQSLKGTTVIFSTHILADVENICDFILIIDKGKILAQDAMENLKRAHAKDTAEIRFYNTQDAERFKAHTTGFTVEAQSNPLAFLLRANDIDALSQQVAGILHDQGLPFEGFHAHTPSLENIFYEVIDV
jgi:ABC-2 type transport system ATP-binding protein